MNQEEHLRHLREIRALMERSSRFISLSGLSGVSAGIVALMGAAAFYVYTQQIGGLSATTYRSMDGTKAFDALVRFAVLDGALVLLAAIGSAIWFTTRNARRRGLPIWDASSRRLVLHLAIPLAVGGLLIGALLLHGMADLVASVTLIFYGLALINAAKYTIHDVFYLGLCQVGLGLWTAYWPGHGLMLWAFGFGVLHIVYGVMMYYKYERNPAATQ